MERLYLYGEIDYISVQPIIERLNYLRDHCPRDPDAGLYKVVLHISTFGGNIYDGLALLQTIQSINTESCLVKVNTHIDSRACTTGFLVWLAGNMRTVYAESRVWLSEVEFGVEGTKEFIEESLRSSTFLNTSLQRYLERETTVMDLFKDGSKTRILIGQDIMDVLKGRDGLG